MLLVTAGKAAHVSFRLTRSDWKCASPYSNMQWARNISLYSGVSWNLTTQYRSGFLACMSFHHPTNTFWIVYSHTASDCSPGESPESISLGARSSVSGSRPSQLRKAGSGLWLKRGEMWQDYQLMILGIFSGLYGLTKMLSSCKSLCQRHGLVMAEPFGIRELTICWYHSKAVNFFPLSGWWIFGPQNKAICFRGFKDWIASISCVLTSCKYCIREAPIILPAAAWRWYELRPTWPSLDSELIGQHPANPRL